MNNRIFGIGKLFVTRTIKDEMEKNETFMYFVQMSLIRYVQGDFGELSEDDMRANEEALEYGNRIMGVYKNPDDESKTIWFITEADRSITTILFPEEY